MNVYLIDDGSGAGRCFQGAHMAAAIRAAEDAYIADLEDLEFNETIERDRYREELLQSCALVGELVNPEME